MSHYKPYPAYRPSGVEWIGAVPDHWRVTQLKNIATTVNGATPESGKQEYWDGDVAWYTPTDIDNEVALELGSPRRYISQAGFDSCAVKLSPPGSVILSTRAPIGSVGITTIASTINQGCRTLIPDQCVPTSFLASILIAARGEMRLRGNGTTFQELSTDALRSLRVPMPPREESNSIACTIDRETNRIDSLISKKTRFVELLKEKRQALITHAVTKGLDPKVKMRDSGVEWIGEVPEHWSVSRLGHFASVENGTTPATGNELFWENGTIPWLGSGEVNQQVVTQPTKTITELALQQCSLRLLPVNTLIIGMVGQGKTRGLAAILKIAATINQNLAAICTGSKLKPDFLLFVFQAAYEWIREAGRGSNQAAMNCEIIAEFRFGIPDIQEQGDIVSMLSTMSERIDLLTRKTQHSIDLLKERRSAFITAAVTGQIDLREPA